MLFKGVFVILNDNLSGKINFYKKKKLQVFHQDLGFI